MQLGQPEAGDVIAGRYEVIDRLGIGGFGAVYRARQIQMNREVAVKTMLPHLANVEDVETRFRREAELASNLTSPHTIRLYDFGKTPEGMLYMVMELLEGQELAVAMKQEAPFEPERAKKVATGILDSLAEAHAHGVVHRDLKPSNIFLAQRRRDENFVKVLDFGIAKAMSQSDEDQQQLTATGQALGTPYYMAPEQIRGKNVGGHTDLYALGLMMIEMLTGRVAVQGATPLETVLIHVNDDPIPMPPWLRASAFGPFLEKATSKNWQYRYQSADDMLADLEAIDTSAIKPGAVDAQPATMALTPDTGSVGGIESGQVPQYQSGQVPYQSGHVPQYQSGQLQYQSGQVPQYQSGQVPQYQSGQIPYQSGQHAVPGAMHTPYPGIQDPEASKGGKGKVVALLLLVLLVGAAGVAVFTLMPDSGTQEKEAEAAASNDDVEGDADGTTAEESGDDQLAELEAMTAETTVDETVGDPAADGAATGGVAGAESDGLTEAEAEPEIVTVTIDSEPSGADVKRDGEVLGQTPYTFEEPKADGNLELVVAKDDYEDSKVEVDLAAGGELAVTLEKKPERKASRRDRKRDRKREAKVEPPPEKKEEKKKEEKKPKGGSLAVD